MSAVKSLDSKVTVGMFFKSMQSRFTKLLAGTMTPEEKLSAIVAELEKDVQAKRVLARQIGAQMRAIADPETAELEPLEAAKAKRAKLVQLGGQNLGNQAKLGQIQQEIKSLDAMVASQQGTYDTLQESYNLAKGNYTTALSALDNVRNNGPAMLKAIRAHQDALKMRDRAAGTKQVDASFMTELTAELNSTRAELRTDKAIEDDLDATKPSLDTELEAMDAGAVDGSLLAEFQAAAAAKK